MNTHTIDSSLGKIEVFTQGAHLSSWVCDGAEQLFLSDQAIIEPGVALRGGVPLCFPQFATFGPGQKHGFARNIDWTLTEQSKNALNFELHANPKTHSVWPHPFTLAFNVEMKERALVMRLSVTNTGTQSFEFGAALHTYFRIKDVRKIKILGLQGQTCWDNGQAFDQRHLDKSEYIEVNGPIDRVYFDIEKDVELHEGSNQRLISKTGFDDIVVWNPWKEGASGLKDMSDDEYLKMICIEAANVDSQIQLNAGEVWIGEQQIKLLN